MNPPAPSSAPRSRVWLRAIALAPVLVVAFGFVAGQAGHSTLPTDTLFGAEAMGRFVLYSAAAHLALIGYGFAVLVLYALLFIQGFRQVWSSLRRALLGLVALAVLSAWGLDAVRHDMRDEIGSAALLTEHIPANAWSVRRCGRSSALCLSWQGSLGAGGVKQYLGAPQAVQAAHDAWQRASAEGAPLAVEWGRTTSGWVAVRQAAADGRVLRNEWFAGEVRR